jgi:hypothetical protein
MKVTSKQICVRWTCTFPVFEMPTIWRSLQHYISYHIYCVSNFLEFWIKGCEGQRLKWINLWRPERSFRIRPLYFFIKLMFLVQLVWRPTANCISRIQWDTSLLKVKLSLCLTNEALQHEGVRGSGYIDLRFLDPGIIWMWVVSFTPRPFYSTKKYPRPHHTMDRRLDGPRNQSTRQEEEKIIYPTGTRTPTPLVQPVTIPTAYPTIPYTSTLSNYMQSHNPFSCLRIWGKV